MPYFPAAARKSTLNNGVSCDMMKPIDIHWGATQPVLEPLAFS
jgi:hypothetical protein